MPSAELLRIFAEEASRHLDAAREELERDRPRARELLRRLHSVKGMALSLGLEDLARRLHHAEELASSGEAEGWVDALPGLIDAIEQAQQDPALRASAALPRQLPPLPVPTARLDRLLDLTLRLSSAHERLEHRLGPSEEQPEIYHERTELAEAVRALRGELLRLRLMAVRSLMPLLRAAFARWSSGRPEPPQLTVLGDGVRLDRALVEALLDPLGHLLRNALVHGIEPPDERAAAAKPRRGRVTIAFRHEGERLTVRVSDDGRGIEAREVLTRARRNEIGGSARATSVSEALALLTEPGMAGGGVAGTLGGRGVGLAAVRAEVERLGGELWLESERGRGFTATLRLPQLLALLDVLIVEVGGQPFAVPMADVREIRRTPLRGAADLGPLPGATPRAWLRIDAAAPAQLGVERVAGRNQAVVRPLGRPLDHGTPWLGAALLPEGGLALVLDPLALART